MPILHWKNWFKRLGVCEGNDNGGDGIEICFSNSLIIHQVKTKEITTVKEPNPKPYTQS